MKSHIQVSFYTATLFTVHGNEPWLLPARNLASINPLPVPDYCKLEIGEFIWLPLDDFYVGDNGYTFVFYYNGRHWNFDQTCYGYNWLHQRYLSIINAYEQSQLEAYQ